VAHAFNALPKDLRTLLIGGGVAAVAGKKLGLGGLGGKVLGGVTGNALGGKGGVVPVFVTNPGLGGPGGLGKGAGGAAGGAAAGAATGWAATIKSSVKSALPKILPLALKLAPLTFAAGASGSTFGPDVNGVRQGPGGLPWMKGPTSTLAPAEMQGWDSKQIKEYNDALAASKVNLEVLREPFRGVLQAVTEIGFGATMSGDRLVYAGMSAKDFSQGLQSLPKGVQTRVETPGAITSLNDVKALTTLYDLTPKQVRTLMELVGANKANAEVGRLAKAYHLTPRQVRTLVQEAGAKPSAEKIRALAQLYHRTPKQIRTLLAAVDQASGKARAAQKAARELVRTFEAKLAADDNSTPKARAAQRAGLAFARAAYRATLFAKDDASPKARAAREKAAAFAKKYLATLAANNGTGPGVSAARAAVNSVHDRTVTITTNYVVNRTVRTLQAAGKRLPQADGGMFDGNTQTFADGGYTDDGRYVPRIPQIRRGGGNVLWSEPETGWEAYISGKPGMRERNLDILTQAADRLGARVERRYADGGVHAAAKGRLNPNLDRLIKAVREARRDGLVSARDAHYVIAQIQKNHSTKGLRDELNKFIKQLNQARSKGFNGDTIDYLNQQFAGHPGGGGKAGKIKRGFDLKGGMTVADINAEFAELRKALHLSRNAFGGLRKEADRVAHAYSRNTAALEKSRDKLNQLRADRAAYASEVTGAFRHDPFGNGAAGLKLQLEADRNDAKAALDYAKVLNGKGISDALEKALFASGDLTTISQLAGMSKAQIAEYNKLYAASQATTKAVGTFEANQAYGKQINAQNVLIRRQTRVLDNLAKRIEGIERAAERGVARGLAGHVRKTNQRAKAGR
jgi:hypothetical protein